MSRKNNPLLEACTSILADMERRTAIQRQLIESQKAMLEALRACNAKMQRLVCTQPRTSAANPQAEPTQAVSQATPLPTEPARTNFVVYNGTATETQSKQRQVSHLVRIK